MTSCTIEQANIIEQALHSEDGTCTYWLSQTTPQLVALLNEHGLVQIGTKPRSVQDPQPFWGVWEVVDRPKALAAVLPFRTPAAPIFFSLTPFEQEGHWAQYRCPACQSTDVYFHDGDSVGVPVLPEGITHYEEIDTSLMVGNCKACSESIFFYEFGFASVPNPDDDVIFVVSNLAQIPDRFQMFRAEAEGMAPWIVSRLFYDTGKCGPSYDESARRLPKGPFVVDLHQFGPFSLAYDGELSGAHGVARCSSGKSSNKWKAGEELFRNLAANAMKVLRESAPNNKES